MMAIIMAIMMETDRVLTVLVVCTRGTRDRERERGSMSIAVGAWLSRGEGVIQGYLAHAKHPPHMEILGLWVCLMSEVPLYVTPSTS